MPNQNKTCDIIIPTWQSEATIEEVLSALLSQQLPPDWKIQVIISDDGSTDDSLVLADQLCRHHSWPYQIIHGAHTGAAGARNRGLAQSQADLIVFLGADIILRPGALLAHLTWHHRHPATKIAALGHIAWDPRLKPSPFMEWLVHGGPQNDFDSLLGQRLAAPHRFWYGSHLSVKRALLIKDTFAEVFQRYGWEDAELGRRLESRGVNLHVLFTARALHRHNYLPQDVLRRQQQVGQNLHVYQRLHPSLTLGPSVDPSKKLLYRLLIYSGTLTVLRLIVQLFPQISLPKVFKLLTNIWFWQGLWMGSTEPKRNYLS